MDGMDEFYNLSVFALFLAQQLNQGTGEFIT